MGKFAHAAITLSVRPFNNNYLLYYFEMFNNICSLDEIN